jgi:gp16 family phage-associated protein
MKIQKHSQSTEFPVQLEAVREKFFMHGLSVADWARERGFRLSAVYQLLGGRTLARRSIAHQIAVTLGVKPCDFGPIEPLPMRPAKEHHM